MIQADTPVLLEVDGLTVVFPTNGVDHAVVESVDLGVRPGEIIGLVGESGSGKSITAHAIIGLIPYPGRLTGGTVRFLGRDLTGLSRSEMRTVLGKEIGIVFQDPMTSLNPVLTIGSQITEVLQTNLNLSKEQAKERAVELLEEVDMPGASHRLADYPHQFSGGMRQRIMIAIAIACSPKLIIADEPTTALDATTQAEVLAMLHERAKDQGAAMLFITHDLTAAAAVCDRICVMYGGRVVEVGPTVELLARPVMPYTKALLESAPRLDLEARGRLKSIDGSPPDPARRPQGCQFAPRCEFARAECGREPELKAWPTAVASSRLVRCWAVEEGGWLQP